MVKIILTLIHACARQPFPRHRGIFVVHVRYEDLYAPPLAFRHGSEILVQIRLLPGPYHVDGLGRLEIDEMTAVFREPRVELEFVDEQDSRQGSPFHERVGLVEYGDHRLLAYPVACRDPRKGVTLIEFGEYRRPFEIRELSPDHRPFQRDGERLAACLAHVFDPMAYQHLLFQDV